MSYMLYENALSYGIIYYCRMFIGFYSFLLYISALGIATDLSIRVTFVFNIHYSPVQS
jgi:hypothetical protein